MQACMKKYLFSWQCLVTISQTTTESFKLKKKPHHNRNLSLEGLISAKCQTLNGLTDSAITKIAICKAVKSEFNFVLLLGIVAYFAGLKIEIQQAQTKELKRQENNIASQLHLQIIHLLALFSCCLAEWQAFFD